MPGKTVRNAKLLKTFDMGKHPLAIWLNFINFALTREVMKPEIEKARGIPGDIIVVIGRQFGSGGRRVGRLLAERLGLEYYDKELLAEASRSLGFSAELFARADEKRPSLFGSLFFPSLGVQDCFSSCPVDGESLYQAQSGVIEKLGREGGCVFVGRTADYILRGREHLASIFLHSPLDERARNIVERGDAPDQHKARDLAQKRDKERESYYNYFTGRRWGVADNYDLSVDPSLLGDEATAEVIESFIRARFRTKQLR